MEDTEVIEEVQEEEVTEEEPSQEPVEKTGRQLIEEAFEQAEQEGEVEEAVTEEPSTEEDLQATDGIEDAEVDEEPPIEYPSSWSAEVKDKVRGLPRDVQEWFADVSSKQQAYFTKASQELNGAKQYYQGLEEALTPHRRRIVTEGDSIPQRLGYLLEADQMMAEDPESTLVWLANQNGINLQELATRASATVDPYRQQVTSEIGQLRQELEQERTMRERYRQQQEIQSLAQQVAAFGAEVDMAGNPLRPHWDTLQTDIEQEIGILRQRSPNASHREILQTAYDRAVKLRGLNSGAEERKKIQAAKEKAARAKRSGKSISGSSATSIAKEAPKDRRGALERAWENANA